MAPNVVQVRVGVAEKVHASALRFQTSVGRTSPGAFTSEKVKQLRDAVDELKAGVDELKHICSWEAPGNAQDVNVVVDPQVVAKVVDPQVVVKDVVKAANKVVEEVKRGNVTSGADQVSEDVKTSIDGLVITAERTKEVLYLVQVEAAKVAAAEVLEVAGKLTLENYKVMKLVKPLRLAVQKVLDVVPARPSHTIATPPHAATSEAELAELVKSVKSAAEKITKPALVNEGDQLRDAATELRDVRDAATELRDATNKAQLYANIKTAKSYSQAVLDAAVGFKNSVIASGAVPATAYTNSGVDTLRSATNTLLTELCHPDAAAELRYDPVNFSDASTELVRHARAFHQEIHQEIPSVSSNKEFKVLVDSIRVATGRVLLVVKLLGAAQEVLGAAEEFRDLANQDPRNVDPYKQAKALEKIQGAAYKLVTGSQPKVFSAAQQVEESAKALQEVDRSKLGKKLEEFHGKLHEVYRSVDEDRNEYAYTEAVNLSLIKLSTEGSSPKYPLHKAALEDWEQKEKDLNNKVSRRQTRSADLTNQIYNIIGWYAVFLGVVLSAVSQLTPLQSTPTQSDTKSSLPESEGKPLCGKIWFPITLTLFSMVVTIAGIWKKFNDLQSLEETINKEKHAQTEIERRINTLRRKGPKTFSFTTDVKNDLPYTQPKEFSWGTISLVILPLLTLAVLFILSYYVILCDKFMV